MIRLAAALAAAALLQRAARPVQVRSIARISRVVADLDRAVGFYRDCLGFQLTSRGPLDPRVAALLRTGPAHEAVLRLGVQEVALVAFAARGAPYPADSRSNDCWFQHLAIVVPDMDAAFAHLARIGGWTPISAAGPVTLPPANGSVRAFKFRDPDGHPLELIWFPAAPAPAADRLFARIDHSALAVAQAARSAGFYRALGFRVAARSFNHGPAQSQLDGLPAAKARIISLRPPDPASAGLELLGYVPPGRAAPAARAEDGVTDWVTLRLDGAAAPRAIRDPDGHRLILAGRSAPQ